MGTFYSPALRGNSEIDLSDGSSKYYKSRRLISSIFKGNLNENKIVAYCVYKINRQLYTEDETGSIRVCMKAKELRPLLGGNDGSFYKTLKNISKSLPGRTIGIERDDIECFAFMSFIPTAIYADGTLNIEFNKYLNHILTNLEKGNFSGYNWLEMMKYESNYSFRLAELLQQDVYLPKKGPQKTSWKIEYGISELKFKLGVIDTDKYPDAKDLMDNRRGQPDYDAALDLITQKLKKNESLKYSVFADFKRYCIEPAVDEINEKSSLDITCDYKKGGANNKVYSVVFLIRLKTQQKEEESVNDNNNQIDEDDFIDLIHSIIPGLTTKEARALAIASDYKLDIISEKYNMSLGKKIDNLVGWLIDAIKKDYKMPETKINKSVGSYEKVNEYVEFANRQNKKWGLE